MTDWSCRAQCSPDLVSSWESVTPPICTRAFRHCSLPALRCSLLHPFADLFSSTGLSVLETPGVRPQIFLPTFFPLWSFGLVSWNTTQTLSTYKLFPVHTPSLRAELTFPSSTSHLPLLSFSLSSRFSPPAIFPILQMTTVSVAQVKETLGNCAWPLPFYLCLQNISVIQLLPPTSPLPRVQAASDGYCGGLLQGCPVPASTSLSTPTPSYNLFSEQKPEQSFSKVKFMLLIALKPPVVFWLHFIQ